MAVLLWQKPSIHFRYCFDSIEALIPSRLAIRVIACGFENNVRTVKPRDGGGVEEFVQHMLSMVIVGVVAVGSALADENQPRDSELIKRSTIAGPLRPSKNPNYFEDADGTSLVLCGSHTWNTLQDWGTNGAVQPLNFDAFVSFLKAHGHNFTLLWYTELPKFHGLPTTEK